MIVPKSTVRVPDEVVRVLAPAVMGSARLGLALKSEVSDGLTRLA